MQHQDTGPTSSARSREAGNIVVPEALPAGTQQDDADVGAETLILKLKSHSGAKRFTKTRPEMAAPARPQAAPADPDAQEEPLRPRQEHLVQDRGKIMPILLLQLS